MNYIESLNKALNFIEEHIMEDITIIDVANHIYFSPYHFQRIFTLMTGITVSEYLRKRKLTLAAYDLQNTKDSIINIAYKYGYDTPESFSKAFKRFHGINPKEVKLSKDKVKSFSPLHIKVTLKGAKEMNYQIKKLDEMKIVVLVREFDSETSNEKIPLFWNEYYQKGYQNKVCSLFGVCLPLEEDNKKFLYGIGEFKKEGKDIPNEFEVRKIPSATWATFECIGPMPKAIQNKWKEIYEEWLPSSKYDIINGYDFEIYSEGNNQLNDYKSEIWVMVKTKNE